MAIKDHAKRQQRENYVARQVLAEARANEDLFEKASKGDTFDEGYASELAQKYELTKNQSARLNRTAERTQRAREIISYLEQKFGANELGEFQDAAGLYRAMIGRKAPKSAKARRNGLAIEFEINNWRYKIALGKAGRSAVDYDQLEAALEQTKERIETGKTVNIGVLAIRIPTVEKIARMNKKGGWKTEEQKLMEAIFGRIGNKRVQLDYAKNDQDKIKQHEIKHVHDNIIGSDMDFHKETSAYLFEELPIRETLENACWRLTEGLKERRASVNENINKLKALNAPEELLKRCNELAGSFEKKIEETNKHFDNLNQRCANLKTARIKKKLSGKTLSYVFSISSETRIMRRIDCLDKLFGANENKSE